MSTPFRAVGRIVKAHGLTGEVSVAPAADLPFMLSEGLHVWLVPPPASVREGTIEQVRMGPKGPLVKISGIDGPEIAQQLRGVSLSVPEDTIPEDLAEQPFDPVGLQINTDDGHALGRVTEVIITGANDVWIVRGGEFGEVLLPVIDDVIVDLDFENHMATVRLLDGLIDEGKDG